MKRVLVFENSLSGHRANYVRLLGEALLSLDVDLKLALPKNALDTVEGNCFLADLINHAEHIPLENISTELSVRKNSKRRFQMLRETILSSKANHVFVPYADGITQAWGMHINPQSCFPKGVILEGLMMRGGFAYPTENIKQKLSRELSWKFQQRSRWDRLHQLDPLVYSEIHRRDANFAKRVRLIPDPVEPLSTNDRSRACKLLGITESSTIITCPGAVREQKGCDKLVEAVDQLRCVQDIKLILWGKHSEKVLRVLRGVKNPDRFYSIDRFASDLEFDALFAAADLVAVCYPRHIGSASILIRATRAKKPILASDWGWIGWACEGFDLGLTCDATDSETIQRAIGDLLKQAPNSIQTSSRKSDAFSEFHSISNHINHWTQLIREKLDLPAAKTIPMPNIKFKAS